MDDLKPFDGTIGGPVLPEDWKRAVVRPPPKNFYVKPLPPEKHGNVYNYGFRVAPINDDCASIVTRTSVSDKSAASVCEYDVWRKWEDCLWYQDNLETEYTHAAREKRNRLAAGKGIKKDGIYIHSDQAASWESLPFGPVASSIACDIHEYVPKLTKRTTFFRASQDTVHQRYEEILAMMEVLFSDELPTLIKELKATGTFTDFFGVWKRDVELARKAVSSEKPSPNRSRHSLSFSMFSTPSASSTHTFRSRSVSKGKEIRIAHLPVGTSIHSDSSLEDSADALRPGRMMTRGEDISSGRSRASSSESRSSSSSPSTPAGSPPTSRVPLMASQEPPLRFGHNPYGGERSQYSLRSLPEDRELPPLPRSSLDEVSLRKISEPAARHVNRSARVYVPPPGSQEFSEKSPRLSSQSLSRSSRASYQSRCSSVDLRAATYLDELDVDYCLPSPSPVPQRHPRASVCTMASVMTNSSVDAVIPRNDRTLRRSINVKHLPDSLREEPEHEQWLENVYHMDDQGDLLDAYFGDMILDTPVLQDYPETPMSSCFSHRQSIITTDSSCKHSDRRSSLCSQSTSSSGNPGILSIKAMHENDIIMLRLPSYISFDDLRRKIYDKFIQVENPTICVTFAIALVERPSAEPELENGRPRAASISTVGSAQSKFHFISSQQAWDDVVATHRGGKMMLRIIGSRE